MLTYPTRLSYASGVYGEQLPVRLLLGTSPDPKQLEVTRAELDALAAAHDGGGRPDAAAAAREWATLADEMTSADREPDGSPVRVGSVQLARFFRRANRVLTDSNVNFIDGQLVESRTDEGWAIIPEQVSHPFVFRFYTAELAASADADPETGLAELMSSSPPLKSVNCSKGRSRVRRPCWSAASSSSRRTFSSTESTGRC